MARPLIAALVSLAVIGTSVLCCCIGKWVLAVTAKTPAHSCCGSDAPGLTLTAPCDCTSLRNVPAEAVRTSTLLSPPAGADFVLMDSPGRGPQSSAPVLLFADTGPPRSGPASVPLYVMFHSLRL